MHLLKVPKFISDEFPDGGLEKRDNSRLFVSGSERSLGALTQSEELAGGISGGRESHRQIEYFQIISLSAFEYN